VQALTMLNDPTFVEAAAALASQSDFRQSADTRESTSSLADQIQRMHNRVVSRDADETTMDLLLQLHQQQLRHYEGNPKEAAAFLESAGSTKRDAETAAMVAVARVLLNLHEAIMRY
ncbi:MAG: peptidylprolyl isomerase, partial [Planctomycetota bacterium]